MDTIKLTFLGDISFSGKNRRSEDFFIDNELASLFEGSDVVIGNFESTLARPNESPGLFQSDSGRIGSLKNSGLSHVFLANNHIYDYGYDGFKATLDSVENEGLIPVGLHLHYGKDQRIVTVEHRGIRVGILGCGWTKVEQDKEQNQYLEYDEEEICDLIKANIHNYDHLIVVAHKGKMFVEYPSVKDRRAFKKYLSLGVSVVIGHHPHVIQGVELLNHQLIAYSLGNFFFDSTEGHVRSSFSQEKQDLGIVLNVELSKKQLVGNEVIPVFKQATKTTLLPSSKEKAFMKHLNLISKRAERPLVNGFFFCIQFVQFVLPHFLKVKMHHLLKAKRA